MSFALNAASITRHIWGAATDADGRKENKTMKHKAVRVDNLMYKGRELHWKCIRCGKCVPKHCYTKEQFEAQECAGEQEVHDGQA